jgi:hypothetical protein
VEVFDPKTRHWRSLPAMPTARSELGLDVLHGRLHAFGGTASGLAGDSSPLRNHEVYTPSWERWDEKTPLHEARAEPGAAVVGDELYAVGGRGRSGPLATVEVYAPFAEAWRREQRLKKERYAHGAAALFGDVHVVAGRHAKDHPLRTAESCAMASTLFLHRKRAPGEGVAHGRHRKAKLLPPPAVAPAALARHHRAAPDPVPVPAAEARRRAVLLVMLLALLAVLAYGYWPGAPAAPGGTPAPATTPAPRR